MTDRQLLNTAYGNMAEHRYRQQTSLSFSPELVSLLDDLRDETGINRSKIAEHMMWYAVRHGVLDETEAISHAD